MLVGSFWIDFDVKLSQKWFKSGFEALNLKKNRFEVDILGESIKWISTGIRKSSEMVLSIKFFAN